MMRRVIQSLRNRGLLGTVRLALKSKIKSLPIVVNAVANKSGIEIGGPSKLFGNSGICPIYRVVASLDNVVFSTNTVWEGERPHGNTFEFHSEKSHGWNYVLEGSDLSSIPVGKYDFVLSSHNLEHFANPVKALYEWMKITKSGGHILLVLPDKAKTFDYRRPTTSIDHMFKDYHQNVGEEDLTHLPEILAMHDLSRDQRAGTKEEFEARSLLNFKNRCLHHHVFDEQNAGELVRKVGLIPIAIEKAEPFHIFLFLQRT